jgi:hypothetical protein
MASELRICVLGTHCFSTFPFHHGDETGQHLFGVVISNAHNADLAGRVPLFNTRKGGGQRLRDAAPQHQPEVRIWDLTHLLNRGPARSASSSGMMSTAASRWSRSSHVASDRYRPREGIPLHFERERDGPVTATGVEDLCLDALAPELHPSSYVPPWRNPTIELPRKRSTCGTSSITSKAGVSRSWRRPLRRAPPPLPRRPLVAGRAAVPPGSARTPTG